MKQRRLAGTDVAVSRLSFGTASLHHIGNAQARETLLMTAAEAGFSHFDTAPYYGFGLAERALAPVLRHYPETTVTTKAGLYPPGGVSQSAVQMLVRKAGGKLVPALSRPQVDWRVARARASLETSLRSLGRDHVDVFLLHEPEIALIAAQEWQAWLDAELGQRVRAFGLAGEPAQILPFVKDRSGLARVIQTRDSLSGQDSDLLRDTGTVPQITFGYFAAAQDSGREPEALLAGALARNPEGTVLVSTRRAERVRALAEMANRLEPA